MKRHILDQDAPGLAMRLRSLDGESQQKIVATASVFTAERLVNLSKTTAEVLDQLRLEGEFSPDRAQFVMALAEAADEKYFLLREQGLGEDQWGTFFSEARLLRGIAVGFGASPQEDVADAIYELIKAVEIPPIYFDSFSHGWRQSEGPPTHELFRGSEITYVGSVAGIASPWGSASDEVLGDIFTLAKNP